MRSALRIFGLLVTLTAAAFALWVGVDPDRRESLAFRLRLVPVLLEVNVDEDRVPDYALPPLLEDGDGAPVETRDAWRERRRELLALFRSHGYGETPETPSGLDRALVRETTVFSGAAVRRELAVPLGDGPGAPQLDLMLHLPTGAADVPVFLGLNFRGNHAVHPDPTIPINPRWMPLAPDEGIRRHRAGEGARGSHRRRWPLETIVGRGYGIATAYAGDAEPDHAEGWREGVRAALAARVPVESWGAIGAWAYALRRALDALEHEPGMDARRVIVIGHSRLGKAALWAAAQDERFAAAISNDSGCMGAAISRRRFGETVGILNRLFPHWMPPRFDVYGGAESTLPFDQHMLLALVAPRPLYVASAVEDLWADPEGEFVALRAASAVYRVLGHAELAGARLPEPGVRIEGRVAYHRRPGGHDLLLDDWEAYLDFADAQVHGETSQAFAGAR